MHKRSDLPLHADPSTRFVPWIIALMVYLATISMLIAITVSSIVNRWDQGFSTKMTIEVPAILSLNPEESTQLNQERLEKVVSTLRRTKGIYNHHVLTKLEIQDLMKPWVGDEAVLKDLPLSNLIDVTIQDREALNISDLQKTLTQMVPGTSVEDHLSWQRGIFDLARTAEYISFLIVSLIGLAAIATIAFTSQTSLIIHSPVIDILHLIGARNSYIAGQFQNHAFNVGIKGGITGTIFTLLTLGAFYFLSQQIDMSVIHQSISIWRVFLLALLIPAIITFLMMLSARFTVLVMLRKM